MRSSSGLARSNRALVSRVAAPCVLALLGACDHHYGGGGGGGGGGYNGPTVVYEQEPNDFDYLANNIGAIAPGDEFEIRGYSSAYSSDLRDGFAFYAQVPCQIYFDLVIHDAFSDLDVCLYDPYYQSVVACWETSFNPEGGDFAVLDPGTDFHLYVEPYLGSAEYSLYVSVYPLGYAPQSEELGALRPGTLEAADPELAREKHAARARREPYTGGAAGAGDAAERVLPANSAR